MSHLDDGRKGEEEGREGGRREGVSLRSNITPQQDENEDYKEVKVGNAGQGFESHCLCKASSRHYITNATRRRWEDEKAPDRRWRQLRRQVSATARAILARHDGCDDAAEDVVVVVMNVVVEQVLPRGCCQLTHCCVANQVKTAPYAWRHENRLKYTQTRTTREDIRHQRSEHVSAVEYSRMSWKYRCFVINMSVAESIYCVCSRCYWLHESCAQFILVRSFRPMVIDSIFRREICRFLLKVFTHYLRSQFEAKISHLLIAKHTTSLRFWSHPLRLSLEYIYANHVAHLLSRLKTLRWVSRQPKIQAKN